MGVDTAISAYSSLVQQVFSAQKQWSGDGRFKATRLEEVIKSVVQDVAANPDELLLEVGDESVCQM